MEIKRSFCNQPVYIHLTYDEICEAHKEYCINSYVADVNLFIRMHLGVKDIIGRTHLKEMATLFYDEKLNEYTNVYAMAKAVIPYLENLGINCNHTPNDFIDSDIELNCI